MTPLTASHFEAGVEAMRLVAVDRVNEWHKAKWNDQESLSIAEVHQLLNCVSADIQIAAVQGEQ
jgi:hypothetical protein